MANLRQALAAAILMYRPAAVKYTLYRGHEAVDITEDGLTGRCDFIIAENGAPPMPQTREARLMLGELLYEGIGYTPKEERKKAIIPKFIKEDQARRTREGPKEADPFEGDDLPAPKPKKKIAIKKSKTILTKRKK